jgi:hypothetical protein
MIEAVAILKALPPTHLVRRTIKKHQSVSDIMKEVLDAHGNFAADYDRIAPFFGAASKRAIAATLFAFLKKNVAYKVEPDRDQTTKGPAALLLTAKGDCKHYASFIGGVLDALNRRGAGIDWNYRFASYDMFSTTPGHVFVVMRDDQGKALWVDPVLKLLDERVQPYFFKDEKKSVDTMLTRISGIDTASYELDAEDQELRPDVVDAISILLNYGVMDTEGRVNDTALRQLSQTLLADEFRKIADARLLLHGAAVGGLFSDIFRGVKKVSLLVPRNAYLSLVALNVFGFASKLYLAAYNSDGTYSQPGQDKLYQLWRSMGGDWHALENAIKSGHTKKAMLAGIGAAAAPAAWVATASAIIAAITPLVATILKSKGVSDATGNMYPYGVCDDGFTPRNADGSCPKPESGSGFDFMQFIEDNPLIVAAVAVGGYYLLTKKKRSA